MVRKYCKKIEKKDDEVLCHAVLFCLINITLKIIPQRYSKANNWSNLEREWKERKPATFNGEAIPFLWGDLAEKREGVCLSTLQVALFELPNSQPSPVALQW